MATYRSRRNPEAEAVLSALCDHLGSVMKTQAVKFPYLVDVVATRVLDRPVTDAPHETWEHGVVCAPLFFMLQHEPEDGGFLVEQVSPWSETQSVRRDDTVEPRVALAEVERSIVRYVADEYGDMSAEQLGRLTKVMNPDVPRSAWGRNRLADVSEDAYERLTTSYQEMAETVNGLDRSFWDRTQPLPDDPQRWI